MRKFILYLLFNSLLLSCFTVNAQVLSLGIRGGISIPNLTAGSGNQNPLNTGYSSRFGPGASVFAEVRFSNHFSLQPMIEYSAQGGKKNGFQALTTPPNVEANYPAGQAPPYLYATYNSEAKINYLLIPLLAKFGWNCKRSPYRVYADVGPFAGYLLSAKQVTSGQSTLFVDAAGQQPLPGGEASFDTTQNIKDQLHKANFGVEGNIGVDYRFAHNSVFVEVGGNYGFLNIQKGSQNGKNNIGAATACIGYCRWF